MLLKSDLDVQQTCLSRPWRTYLAEVVDLLDAVSVVGDAQTVVGESRKTLVSALQNFSYFVTDANAIKGQVFEVFVPGK